jgi:hypothetical protein
MPNLGLVIYDKPRRWITDSREHGVSWEEIELGRKRDYAGLQSFLSLQADINFWPEMSISEWQLLVASQKNAEKHMKHVELLDGIAHIHDSRQDNAITVPEDDTSSWQLYKKKLLADGFKAETVAEIERTTLKILKRLNADTTSSCPVKGLVIGNVQSGKTANMAALMAMAADWGWNMFVVLSGTIENLRVQTQNRLFNDLNQQGSLWWRPLQHLSKKVDISQKAQSLHFDSGSKERYFTVCLKNSTRLKNLIQWAQADKNKQRQMKILVIDDEADQAGINTCKIDQDELSRINKLIRALVNGKNEKNEDIDTQYLAMNYIGYTATPYANILNEAGEESLYPRSFITTLAVSKEYFGPQQIFGYSGDSVSFDGMNIVRTIDADELVELKSIHDGDAFTTPESLLDAVCWFMCGVSCMRIWGYKKPVSMLVHTSQLTAHHSAIANVINDWIVGTPPNDIIKRAERVWYEETSKFSLETFRAQYPTYDRPDEVINKYPDFSDVKEKLHELLGDGISHIELDAEGTLTYHKGIHLCIDNCANNGVSSEGMHVRLAYPDSHNMPSPAPAFIVVGGATLSRGLTIEGLISTFFLRSVGQADTLMQMGRWFGYRKKYELLPRLWITEKTKQQFIFLAALDQELRDEIQHMDITGRSPAEYGPKVKNTPKASFIRITAKNRMQAATEATVDYSGASNQTYLFDNDATTLRDNMMYTEEFIRELGAEWIPSNNYFPNDAVWKNVSFTSVRKYIERFKFCSRLKVFNDTKPLMDWIEKVTSEGKLGDWNVIVAGKKNATNGTWTLPNGKDINKVNRSKKHNQNELDDKLLDIGVLRDPMDLLADVDVDAISDSTVKELILTSIATSKAKGAAGLRDRAGLDTTPQLIIYCVDKNSTAGASTRHNLEADEDVVGVSIYIPGGRIGTSYASSISIKMNSDLFDGDADLEGTDEN